MTITIGEAIDIQEQYLKQKETHIDDRLDDAIKLGIEALKQWKLLRQIMSSHNVGLLHGETLEGEADEQG